MSLTDCILTLERLYHNFEHYNILEKNNTIENIKQTILQGNKALTKKFTTFNFNDLHNKSILKNFIDLLKDNQSYSN